MSANLMNLSANVSGLSNWKSKSTDFSIYLSRTITSYFENLSESSGVKYFKVILIEGESGCSILAANIILVIIISGRNSSF